MKTIKHFNKTKIYCVSCDDSRNSYVEPVEMEKVKSGNMHDYYVCLQCGTQIAVPKTNKSISQIQNNAVNSRQILASGNSNITITNNKKEFKI